MLEDKIKSYLDDGMPYEGLMYVESFIARKKKKARGDATLFGESLNGVRAFLQYNHHEYAGTLVDWTLESGVMQLESPLGHLDQLIGIIEMMPQESAETYQFISKFFLKLRKAVSLHDRDMNTQDLRRVCSACCPIFTHSQRWRQAVECCIVTENANNLCEVLDAWARKGDAKLYLLFFVRVYLYILSKEKSYFAHAVFAVAKEYAETPSRERSAKEVSALWHFVSMINDLLLLTEDTNGRPINKAAIFLSLWEFYDSPLKCCDDSLVPMVENIAVKVFKIRPKQSASPLSMIQSLFNA